jgi:hypothetical protein
MKTHHPLTYYKEAQGNLKVTKGLQATEGSTSQILIVKYSLLVSLDT